jgi:two-component system chemotaxis response regulator CheB
MLVNQARFDVVVLAASSGGLNALRRVIGPLPKWLPVSLAIVQHLAPDSRSYLAQILSTFTAMPVDWAHAGEYLEPGRIYIAPPTHHLLLDASHRCVLSNSARVNYSRPAADPLFQSAAASFGRRVLAVVLSGRLHDASAGVVAVKKAGGVVIAQSPRTSFAPGMPRSAIESGYVDFVIDVDTIASAIVSLAGAGHARPRRSEGSRRLIR